MSTSPAPGDSPLLATSWSSLHQRLDQLDRTADGRTQEQNRAILRRRAEALARPVETAPALGDLPVTGFTVAGREFAAPLSAVKEVFTLREMTRLPGAPPYIAGIANFHGVILALLDLKHFFQLPLAGITDIHKVIVLSNERLEIGLLADTLTSTTCLSSTLMHPPLPSPATGRQADFLTGYSPDGVALLDVARIMEDPRLVAGSVNSQA